MLKSHFLLLTRVFLVTTFTVMWVIRKNKTKTLYSTEFLCLNCRWHSDVRGQILWDACEVKLVNWPDKDFQQQELLSLHNNYKWVIKQGHHLCITMCALRPVGKEFDPGLICDSSTHYLRSYMLMFNIHSKYKINVTSKIWTTLLNIFQLLEFII